MTPENFVYWFQGFSELTHLPPSEAQWKIIQAHLGLVFVNTTADPETQALLAKEAAKLRKEGQVDSHLLAVKLQVAMNEIEKLKELIAKQGINPNAPVVKKEGDGHKISPAKIEPEKKPDQKTIEDYMKEWEEKTKQLTPPNLPSFPIGPGYPGWPPATPGTPLPIPTGPYGPITPGIPFSPGDGDFPRIYC